MPDRLRFPPTLRDSIRDGDTRFLVTGAGGWLGRATLEMLDDALGDAMPGRVWAFAASARTERLRSGREIAFAPLPDLANVAAGASTCIAHYAFLTREKAEDRPLADYVAANRAITGFVAEQARLLQVAGTFSTSSGAVYGRTGGLETSLAANPYGVLKLEEEAAFASIAAELGVPVAICRVFNLGGPFINKSYALGDFVAAALAGRDIDIRAPRRVLRSYVHVRDVVSIGFAAMLGIASRPALPYDTAGAESVEMGELALRVKAVLGRPDLRITRPPPGDGGDDRYVGDGRAFAAMADALGLAPAGLDQQIRDTARYLAA